jgi:hypothetical protein
MSDASFSHALRLHLGLKLIPRAHPQPLACRAHKRNSVIVPTPVDPYAFHAFRCNGSERANPLHALIKKIIIVFLKQILSVHGYTFVDEPVMDEHFQRNPGSTAKDRARGDILVYFDGSLHSIVDVKTVSPISTLSKDSHDVQGDAAHKRYQSTVTYYRKNWAIELQHIVPFVIELGGFIHKDSFNWLHNLAAIPFTTSQLDPVTNTSKPVVDQRSLHRAFRPIIEHIQTAVQNSNGSAVAALVHLSRPMQPFLPPPAASAAPSPSPSPTQQQAVDDDNQEIDM